MRDSRVQAGGFGSSPRQEGGRMAARLAVVGLALWFAGASVVHAQHVPARSVPRVRCLTPVAR